MHRRSNGPIPFVLIRYGCFFLQVLPLDAPNRLHVPGRLTVLVDRWASSILMHRRCGLVIGLPIDSAALRPSEDVCLGIPERRYGLDYLDDSSWPMVKVNSG